MRGRMYVTEGARLREDVLQIRLPLACRRPCCRAHSRDVWQGYYHSCDGRSDTPKKRAPASARAARPPEAQAHACAAAGRQILREKKEHTKPPVSLVGQLLWREFFYTAAALTPNFHRMAGSAICRQIPWDDNEALYRAWDEARTGACPGRPAAAALPPRQVIAFLVSPVPSAGRAWGVHGPCFLRMKTIHECVLG